MNPSRAHKSLRMILAPSRRDHLAGRDMWKGSSLIGDTKHWVLNKGSFEKRPLSCSSALLKCVDEIMVNAVDHYFRTANYSKESGGPVTEIKVNIENNGEIQVYNNGAGIDVHIMETPDRPEVNGRYSVEAVMCEMLVGSNFGDLKDKKAANYRITGGVNGLGMKVVNVSSLYFEIETVDSPRGIYYKQRCEDCMKVCNPPLIITSTEKGWEDVDHSPHTKITFLPDYAELCQDSKGIPNLNWLKNNIASFTLHIQYRCYQIAAFIYSINYHYEDDRIISHRAKPRIYFQNKEVPIHSLEEFAALFPIDNPMVLDFSTPEYPHPWKIVIGINRTSRKEQVSLINGVDMIQGGSHVGLLANLIADGISEQLDKLRKDYKAEWKNEMLNKVFFPVSCFQLPAASFKGQEKESITIDKSFLFAMRTIYKIDKKISDKIWREYSPSIKGALFMKEKKTGTRGPSIAIRKYEKAKPLGTNSHLFIPEGDSALQMVKKIIFSKKTPYGRPCGTYCIQGVPMNALKKIEILQVEGKDVIKQKIKLLNNIGLQGLVKAIGLNYDKDYYYNPSPTREDETQADQGNRDFAKLNYGAVILTTDQDLDGKGNICSLLIVFFHTFWPSLIKRGFIKRLITPIIRVREGKTSTGYDDEKDFIDWANREFGGVDKIPARCKVEYFKGLAGHGKDDVENIGKTIHKNIKTISWTEDSKLLCDIFYGKPTQGRKDLLATPVDVQYNKDLWTRHYIRLNEHFQIESKAFMLDFMKRKLKSAIDGLIPSQRKVLCGCRTTKTTNVKVYQLSGDISNRMCYQHGDASLNQTIIKMAQTFAGTNNIPVLLPISAMFGGRELGRGKTGQARYLTTRYNKPVMNLLFPRVDDCMLTYVYEEGIKCEPLYYVPILPYSIMETSTTAAVGWKISCWGRNILSVINAVVWYIQEDYASRNPIFPDMIGYPQLLKGMRVVLDKYRSSKNVSEICLGSYTTSGNEVHVSQLPLKIWSSKLKCSLLGINKETGADTDKYGQPLPKKEFVKDCEDKTADDVNMTITLTDRCMPLINEKYGTEHISPLEDYLELTQNMSPELNMFNSQDVVHHYNHYGDVMKEWYPLRKKLYIERLSREIIILKLWILFHENQLRFIHMDASNEIHIDKDVEEEDRIRILSSNNFLRLNLTALNNTDKYKTLEIEKAVRNGNYDYIDRITIRMKSKRSIAALQEELASEKRKLAELERTTWKDIWLREIGELKKKIKEGLDSGWLYEKEEVTYL